jgi:hypothetical protein
MPPLLSSSVLFSLVIKPTGIMNDSDKSWTDRESVTSIKFKDLNSSTARIRILKLFKSSGGTWNVDKEEQRPKNKCDPVY